MRENIIPIVFATNNKYVPYCGVAITSIINNRSIHNQYNIYVFYTDLSVYNIERLESLSLDNITVKCLNIKGVIPKVVIKSNQFPIECIYRIIAPYVLTDYKKILYLDCDIVALDDVAKLYNYDIGESIFGAVKEKFLDWFDDYLEEKEIPKSGYFNSGVLLMNTSRVVEENIIGKLERILCNDNKYRYPDQDALNIICNKQEVDYLPDEWNATWHLFHNMSHIIPEHIDRVNLLKEKISILHYTSKVKVWQNPDKEFANYFWDIARTTMFYEEILFANISVSSAEEDIFERFIFPWDKIAPSSNIIIYGGGVVGKTFLKQVKKTKYCTIVAIADINKTEIAEINVPIVSPQKINDFVYDTILIAIERSKVAKEIKEQLVALGYDANKIVWVSPVK